MQSFPGSSRWLAACLSPEALITSLSPGAEQFTGYSAKELAGLPVTQILADSSAFEVPFYLKTAKEWGSWEGEIVHSSRGGDFLKARGTLTMLTSCEGHHCGYLLISNFDASPLSGENDNVASAEIAAKLRIIAHDLSNPLAVMMGFTQLLTLDENCPGKIRTDLEKLYSELQRVIQVVDRLRGYAISLYGIAPNPNLMGMAMKPGA
jgi:two-component system, LuxR family, sensor kinase FixL